MSNPDDFLKNYKESAPEKVRAMSDETLDLFHRYFVDLLPYANKHSSMRLMTEQRIVLLANEMESRRLTKQSDQQHQENQALGKKTLAVSESGLFWAKIAGIAGIAGVIAAAAAIVLGTAEYVSRKPSLENVLRLSINKPATPVPSPAQPVTTPIPAAPLESATPAQK